MPQPFALERTHVERDSGRQYERRRRKRAGFGHNQIPVADRFRYIRLALYASRVNRGLPIFEGPTLPSGALEVLARLRHIGVE